MRRDPGEAIVRREVWRDELLDAWIVRGRWTEAEVTAIGREGAAIGSELAAGRRWWSDDWAVWEPDLAWQVPALPSDRGL